MDNPIYTITQQQISNFNKLAVISNNVANANTPGFKNDSMVFNEFKHSDIHEKYSFPNDIITLSDLKPGAMTPTRRPLDVAVQGAGFFLVRTPAGVRYTRNGGFQLDANNMLVDVRGNPVLSADEQEIVFEEGDTAPMILEDGRVLVNNEERGIIGVVEFDRPTKFFKHEDQNFTTNKPATALENPRVAQGMLEESNSNSIIEITNLINVQNITNMASNYINGAYHRQMAEYRVYAKVGSNS